MYQPFRSLRQALSSKELCAIVVVLVAVGVVGVSFAAAGDVGETPGEPIEVSRSLHSGAESSAGGVASIRGSTPSDGLRERPLGEGAEADWAFRRPNETTVSIGYVCADGPEVLSAEARRILADEFDCLRPAETTGGQQGTAEPASHVELSTDGEPVAIERDVGYEIPFRTGTFVPEPGVSEPVLDGVADKDGRAWVLVQFESTPTPSQFETIQGEGFVVGYTLTPNSFYVGIPTDQVEAVAEREYVRSISAIRPAWRYAPDIWEDVDVDEESMLVTVESMTRLDVEGLRVVDDHDEPGAYLYRGEISGAQLEALREEPGVVWIEPYVRPSTDVAEGRRIVAVPAAVQNPAFTPTLNGSGVVVGVADSTFATGHPHFGGVSITTAARMGSQPVNASDCGSHGTHVAGTIAGQGTDGRGITQRGVAPAADLVVARILSQGAISPNSCNWNNFIRGPKWVFNQIHDQNSDVAIISNSWGMSLSGKYITTSRVTDKWARDNADTLLVFSNGNDNQWVGIPANAKNVLSVGAVYDGTAPATNYTEAPKVLDSASFNAPNSARDDENRGSGRRKPEVYAPGTGITAPVEVRGSVFGYQTKGGTSMAAPHVSGVAALYKEVHSNATANELRAALVGTTTPPLYNGYGVIDANNAIFNNTYESVQAHFTATVYEGGPTATRNITVGSDAEKLVVSAAWMDIQGVPATANSRILKRNITVALHGPNGTHHVNANATNVKKIVVEDPDPGEWELEISPNTLIKDCYYRDLSHPCNQVEVEGIYRVVTEQPTLAVETPDTVTLHPDASSRIVTFDLNVSGTGAPVGGINAQVEGSSGLTVCNPDPQEPNDRRGFVFGSLSQGYDVTQTLCFQVPDQYGTYPVQIDVNSENANRTTITKTVYIQYKPEVELDPYKHEVLPGDWDVYDVRVHGLDGGLGSARLLFLQNDTDVGSFRNASIVATHDPANSSVTVGTDGETLLLEAMGMDTVNSGTATIATIAMKGDQPGITNISVVPDLLANESAAAASGGDPPGRFESAATVRAPERGVLHVGSGPPVEENTSIDFTPTTPTIEYDPTTGFRLSISDAATEYVAAEPVWELGDGTVEQGYAVEHTYEEPGEYAVTATVVGPDGVMTRLTRTVTVDPAETSDLSIPEVTAPSNGEAGEVIEIAATVTNDGEAATTTEVTVSLDGTVVHTTDVEVGAGDRTTVTAEATLPDASGQYEISVSAAGETAMTTITVETGPADATDEGTTTPTGTGSEETPGPGPLGALIAIALTAYLMTRADTR